MNVLILSALNPNKDNRGGPTALIWECISVLENSGVYFDLKVVGCVSRLNKLGIYFERKEDYANYDLIFVYPFNLFFKLNLSDRSKSIVLGPDSPTLLFARFFRSSSSMLNRLKYTILFNWFKLKENQLLSQADKLVVVGKNDLRWVRNQYKFSNVCYLTHPVLTSIVENLKKHISKNVSSNISLVFSGDLSRKYTANYIDFISDVLVDYEFNVIVAGSNNKWVYDLFFEKKIKNLSYSKWVENYLDICDPISHVHIFPLAAGAGTKNRTLTACAVGVQVITSSIGYENIVYGRPDNLVHVFRNIKEFEDIISNLSFGSDFDKVKSESYIDRVNVRFKSELLSFFGDDI